MGLSWCWSLKIVLRVGARVGDAILGCRKTQWQTPIVRIRSSSLLLLPSYSLLKYVRSSRQVRRMLPVRLTIAI